MLFNTTAVTLFTKFYVLTIFTYSGNVCDWPRSHITSTFDHHSQARTSSKAARTFLGYFSNDFPHQGHISWIFGSFLSPSAALRHVTRSVPFPWVNTFTHARSVLITCFLAPVFNIERNKDQFFFSSSSFHIETSCHFRLRDFLVHQFYMTLTASCWINCGRIPVTIHPGPSAIFSTPWKFTTTLTELTWRHLQDSSPHRTHKIFVFNFLFFSWVSLIFLFSNISLFRVLKFFL